MKTQLLFAFVLSLITQISLAQPDKQWLIWNMYGKDGLTSGGNMNNYPTINVSTTGKISLDSIAAPDLITIPKARNNLFVIYSNGEHFNTRYTDIESPGFFYNANDFSNHIDDHNFNMPSTHKISYLYLTNRYEGDDPPKGVKTKKDYSSSAHSIYDLGITNAGLLSANHDIVVDKDLTVIIHNLKLRELIAQDSSRAYLKFDSVQLIADHTIHHAEVLDLQPVFKASNEFLIPTFRDNTLTPTENSEIERLNLTSDPYSYVNFRLSKSGYRNFGPDAKGNARYNAVISIIHKGINVAQIFEPINASHDPNILKVDSLCGTTGTGYMVFYHLEFENVSEQPATELKAEVTFPSFFDLTCIDTLNWFAAGYVCRGTLDIDIPGSKVTFTFRGNRSISQCGIQLTDICKAFVNFRVKTNPGTPLFNPDVSLELATIVYFDNHPFTLDRFLDRLMYKGNEWTRPVDGMCNYCPSPAPLCIPCIILAVGGALVVIGVLIRYMRRRRLQ